MTTRICDPRGDFARFELHQDLCEHLRSLPPGRQGPAWPGAAASIAPDCPELPRLAVGNPVLLAVRARP